VRVLFSGNLSDQRPESRLMAFAGAALAWAFHLFMLALVPPCFPIPVSMRRPPCLLRNYARTGYQSMPDAVQSLKAKMQSVLWIPYSNYDRAAAQPRRRDGS